MSNVGAFGDDLKDTIALLVFEKFKSLPKKYKPLACLGGKPTWTTLSAIIIEHGKEDGCDDDANLQVLSLATGTKCLPASSVAKANGKVIYDWHAEILAIRAFNHQLLLEASALARLPGTESTILRRRTADEMCEAQGMQPFDIHDHVKIWMYCSEAPCGDASMELVMAAQANSTPWPVSRTGDDKNSGPGALKGRESFSELGIVRRKPCATICSLGLCLG